MIHHRLLVTDRGDHQLRQREPHIIVHRKNEPKPGRECDVKECERRDPWLASPGVIGDRAGHRTPTVMHKPAIPMALAHSAEPVDSPGATRCVKGAAKRNVRLTVTNALLAQP